MLMPVPLSGSGGRPDESNGETSAGVNDGCDESALVVIDFFK